MDDVDIAEKHSTFLFETALNTRKRAGALKPTGFCHYCHEPTDKLFCSEECRDDFDWAQKCRSRS